MENTFKRPASTLTTEDEQDIAAAFQIFDSDRDGLGALKALGIQPTPIQLKGLLVGVLDGDAVATFKDYQTFATRRLSDRDESEDVKLAFELLRGDRRVIHAQDLQTIAMQLGEPMSLHAAQAMIDEFDMDGDGASISSIQL